MHIYRNRRHIQTRVLAALAAASLIAAPSLLTAENPSSTSAKSSSNVTNTGSVLVNSGSTMNSTSNSSTGINPQSGKDVVSALEADGRFSTLLTALRTSGVADELKSGGPYTVFAPTDDAFRKMPQDKRDALLSNRDELRDVLQYHVVSGRLSAADLRNMEGITQTSYHSSTSPAMRRDANGRTINSTSDSTSYTDSTGTARTAGGNAARPDSQEGFVDKLLKDHNEPGDAYDPKGAVDGLLGRDKNKDKTNTSYNSTSGTTTGSTSVSSNVSGSSSSGVRAGTTFRSDTAGSTYGSTGKYANSRDRSSGTTGSTAAAGTSGTAIDTTTTTTASRLNYPVTNRPSSVAANNYGNTMGSPETNSATYGNTTTTGARLGTTDTTGRTASQTAGARDGSTAATRAMDEANNRSRFDNLDRLGNSSASVNGSSNTTGAGRDRTLSGVRTADPARSTGNDLREDSLEGPLDQAMRDTGTETAVRPSDPNNTSRFITDGTRDHLNDSGIASGNQPRPDSQEGRMDRMLRDKNEPGDAYNGNSTTGARTGINRDIASGNQPRPDSQEGRMDRMLHDKNEPGDAYDRSSTTGTRTGVNRDIASGNQPRPDSQEGRMDRMFHDKNEPGDAYDRNSTTGTRTGVNSDIASGNQPRPDSQEGRVDRMFHDKNEPGDAYDRNSTTGTRTGTNRDIASGNQPRPDSQEGRVDRMFHDKNEPGDAYDRNSARVDRNANTTTTRDAVNSDIASGDRQRPDSQEGVVDRMFHDKNEPGDAYNPGTTSSGTDVAASIRDEGRRASDWVSRKSRDAADAIDKTIEPNGNSQIHGLAGGGLRISTSGTTVMVNNAHVVSSDISASNGVIHAIDTVLTPDRKVSRSTSTNSSDERSQAPRARTIPYESASLTTTDPFARVRNEREIFGTDRHNTTLMPGTNQVQRDRDNRF